jgi:hypothetical protein
MSQFRSELADIQSGHKFGIVAPVVHSALDMIDIKDESVVAPLRERMQAALAQEFP